MASLGASFGQIQTEVRRQVGSGTTVVFYEGASGFSSCVGLRKDTDLAVLGGVDFPLEAETCALKPPPIDG